MQLVKTEAARRAIAEARSVDEVKDIRDKAEAVRMYAKQAGMGLEMINDAAEIKLRAERRAGEMLAVMEKNKGGDPRPGNSVLPGLAPRLEELGVSKMQSSRWQSMAEIPEDKFEQHIAHKRAEQEELTTAGVLRMLEPESNGKNKPKTNRVGDTYVPQGFDACQTPAYAIDPLLPYLPSEWTIWESACGEGHLLEAFYDASRKVEGSDILVGRNFFEYQPHLWDCQVTNPPYSVKYKWLERSYEFGKPFALLLPVETLGAKHAQVLFVEHGIEIILLDRRINFKMPNKGWDGAGAQFPVAWFTWGLSLPTQLVFASLGSTNEPD